MARQTRHLGLRLPGGEYRRRAVNNACDSRPVGTNRLRGQIKIVLNISRKYTLSEEIAEVKETMGIIISSSILTHIGRRWRCARVASSLRPGAVLQKTTKNEDRAETICRVVVKKRSRRLSVQGIVIQ